MVLTNWEITSSASYYWSSSGSWTIILLDFTGLGWYTYVARGTGNLLWWNILIGTYNMLQKYYFHRWAACCLSVKYLCFSNMVSIEMGNDVIWVGVWQIDLILNYHNFYGILWLFLLSIRSNLCNLALVIHILVYSN